MRRVMPWALLCVFAVLLVASLFALAAWLHGYGFGNEVSLPLLAIAGVVALIGALALVAIGFALMSMSDKTQALGLPSGSVRAVIALSLVVLFAILSVFLFSSLSNSGQVHQQACLPFAVKEAFIRNMRQGEILFTQPSSLSVNGEPCPAAGSLHGLLSAHAESRQRGFR